VGREETSESFVRSAGLISELPERLSCHPPKLFISLKIENYIYFVKNIKQYLKRRPAENISRNRSVGSLYGEKKSRWFNVAKDRKKKF
jgi:hypothetical protein